MEEVYIGVRIYTGVNYAVCEGVSCVGPGRRADLTLGKQVEQSEAARARRSNS